MKDKIIQIEILLNFLNTLFAKATHFKDTKVINELNAIRHGIYYNIDFDYELTLKKIQDVEVKLKLYE